MISTRRTLKSPLGSKASSLRILLDTHPFLWAAGDPTRFSKRARAAIEDSANEIFVSAAVCWELSIKHRLGKLVLPQDPAIYVPARLATLSFKALPVTGEHALAVWGLPPHHNDPFDRIMIAQAQVEGLTFVSADSHVRKYPVHILRAA